MIGMPPTSRERARRAMQDAELTIRLPADLLEAARAKARREGVSVSEIVRQALRDWVGATQAQTRE